MTQRSSTAQLSVKCPACHGKGEMWASAPWARWFTCGACKGTGRLS